MTEVVLLPRAYGAYRGRILETVRSHVNSLASELDVELSKIGTNQKNHIVLSLSGSDEEFLTNLLDMEYSLVPEVQTILPESNYPGFVVDSGKVGYGLYVDLGIEEPKMDALIPLHRLREQLGMNQESLRRIVDTFVLVDNLPVEIKIDSISRDEQKIEAELTSSFIERIESWVSDDHERLLVLGSTKKMIEISLSQTKHMEDIYQIERLGFFEYSLVCKRSTRATGIISAVGPRLRGVPMHLFIPSEVEEKRRA
ncbi:MAG: hypothetical protein BAJATHORv1_20418 [Candidatus Thorarchaeota archaeon]|nr:MAG: hypothetical protein BAJATHORv1_20418 [Candidatus Thorarchaeota archaeon]